MDSKNKIESLKQIIEILKELEMVESQLNRKCKESGTDLDMLKTILVESNSNLACIVKNILL